MASSSRLKLARVKNASDLPIDILISSPELRHRYHEYFANRRVLGSKYLDWDYFSGLNMSFITSLDNLGLKNMIKYKGHWSPKVIRAFYSSLEYRIRERVILADVRGENNGQ